MEKWVSYNGFCPSMQMDYSIDVHYTSEDGKVYTADGESCAYHSMVGCRTSQFCPLRAHAPNTIVVED